MTDSLLQRAERLMCLVWPSVAVSIVRLQLTCQGFEIMWRNDTIRVEEHKIVTGGTFHAVVARQTAAGIGLEIVTHIYFVLVSGGHLVASDRRTILDNQDFKVLQCLHGQTFQQFMHLVGTIIYRYDYGKLHWNTQNSLFLGGSKVIHF